MRAVIDVPYIVQQITMRGVSIFQRHKRFMPETLYGQIMCLYAYLYSTSSTRKCITRKTEIYVEHSV